MRAEAQVAAGGIALQARRAVAEAVMQLVSEGLMDRTPETVRQIALTLGLEVRELRDAWWRIERAGFTAPRPEAAAALVTAAPRVTVDLEQQRRSRQRRGWAEANPTPGMRRCARCGMVQPEELFPWKDGTRRSRRSYDSDCWKAKQRERYVSVSKEKALNAVGIAFLLTEGDDLGRSLCCMECGVPLKAGDHVEGRKVALRHVDCEEAKISWLHRR